MNIFPAIDLYEGSAVRLYKGNYDEMTIYSYEPLSIAQDFVKSGCKCIHVVDLEGARYGTTPNLLLITKIAQETPLFVEVGGGIRNMDTVTAYINAGVDRVIIGTAAVTDEDFLKEALAAYGEKVAVGIDLKDGYVAIKGWTKKSQYTADEFFSKMEQLGVKTVICTDISKDGAMQGTNRQLYQELSNKYKLDIIASGGVSDLADIKALKEMGLYGAIVGKAYYTGAIDLHLALEVAQ